MRITIQTAPMKLLTTFVFSILFTLNLSGCFSVEDNMDRDDPGQNGPAPVIDEDGNDEANSNTDERFSAELKGEDYFNGYVNASNHDWYVSYLKAMEEGPLDQSEPLGMMKFRFLWLRSFDKPYVVRGFQGEDGKLKLHMKSAGGAGGYEPGKKEDDVFVHLTATQATQILEQLEGLKICDNVHDKRAGLDGSNWIFEYLDQGKYCLIDIWSPDARSDYYAFGVNLLKTTRVKTWEIDVY